MRKKVRKLRVMALCMAVLLMAMACLTGCGEQESQPSSSSVETKESTAEKSTEEVSKPDEEELEFVTLTWYYPGNYPQNDQDEVFAAVNEKIKEKINAEVNFQPISWGDYDQKMVLANSSGEAYDLCFTADWSNNYLQNVAKGAYLPLDDLLKEYAPQTYASVPESFWDATRVNGQIYGIINQQIIARSPLLTLNKDLADKYGFDSKTVDGKLENLEPLLEQIAANEPDKVGLTMNFDQNNAYYYGLEIVGGQTSPAGIYMDDADATVVNVYKTDEFKEWASLMYKWNQAGYLKGEDFLAGGDPYPHAEGKRGAWLSGTYKPGVQAEEASKWGIGVYCESLCEPYVATSGVVATMHAIGRNSENPERAMMLMELLNTDKEIFNMLAYGLEGKHYNKLEGDFIELIPDSGYAPGTAWLHASTFNAYLLEGQDADLWEQTKELNASAKVSPLLGFNFDPTPVNTEIAQCASVYNQYLPLFANGVGTMEKDYVEFIDKLEAAGAQNIVDEMQRQIDEWKVSK